MIGGDVQHDFFAKIGSSYNRKWSRASFRWVEGGLLGRTWEECAELANTDAIAARKKYQGEFVHDK